MKINEFIPKNTNFARDLEHIPNPPSKLFIRGELPQKRIKTVAIVGTRKPTNYGREVAAKIASDLAKNGVVVISGLALGIDGIAHRSAIEAGGLTLAVLANGLSKIYPSSHKGLAEKILETGGAIISEYEPSAPALPYQFLERNRLVSGLADAVVVVEAAARSGTLSTATHAIEQGKEVFAVPGNITSPLSAGCNKLVRMGATPLLSTDDLLDFLFPNGDENTQLPLIKGETPAENTIIELLSSGIRDGEILLKKSGLTASDFSQAITMLEIKDAVKSLGGNNWGLK